MPDSIKRVEQVVRECRYIIENLTKLRMLNPLLLRIRGLPKANRVGNEIIAATNRSDEMSSSGYWVG